MAMVWSISTRRKTASTRKSKNRSVGNPSGPHSTQPNQTSLTSSSTKQDSGVARKEFVHNFVHTEFHLLNDLLDIHLFMLKVNTIP
ncbi:unnamed protein product [Cuscuta campestris]|uniref:Uncharacterized protein n=1 Tax=Cuscuta campestris TaxID=132261 RepID=A0A484L3G6_9ASTE|nr:unnamed protein product [Cuscuta campestris]